VSRDFGYSFYDIWEGARSPQRKPVAFSTPLEHRAYAAPRAGHRAPRQAPWPASCTPPSGMPVCLRRAAGNRSFLPAARPGVPPGASGTHPLLPLRPGRRAVHLFSLGQGVGSWLVSQARVLSPLGLRRWLAVLWGPSPVRSLLAVRLAQMRSSVLRPGLGPRSFALPPLLSLARLVRLPWSPVRWPWCVPWLLPPHLPWSALSRRPVPPWVLWPSSCCLQRGDRCNCSGRRIRRRWQQHTPLPQVMRFFMF
jgi:hypothetical protein